MRGMKASIWIVMAVLVASGPETLWGQCNWGGGSSTCSTLGNVQIGPNAPTTYPLEVTGSNGNGIRFTDFTNGVQNFLGGYQSIGITGTLNSVPLALWTNNSEKLRITTGGNVGIGTPAPQATLDVEAPDPALTIGSPSRVTSGGHSPVINLIGNVNGTLFNSATMTAGFYGHLDLATAPNTGSNSFITLSPAGAEALRVTNAGNVGIGTTNPPYPLSVKGTIAGGEVIVTNTSGWSDYVFDPGYRLQPLSELADYVAANRHLPDVPSAAEVEQKGISLGEMQAKLLAKVEELTLHLIEAERANQQLQERVLRLEQTREREK